MNSQRQDTALRELTRTDVTPLTARVLVGLFGATILVVPILQIGAALWSESNGRQRQPWPDAWRAVQVPAVGMRRASEASGGPWRRFMEGNRAMLRSIAEIEDDIDEHSVAGRLVRTLPRTVLLRFGAGTEQVYVGSDGWLFFRPAVDHLTGRGFLDPEQQSRRIESAPSWEPAPAPNPLPAILEFRDQLAALGVDLMIMPVPVKASIHPEKLSSRFEGSADPLHGRSWPRFLEELKEQGVRVFESSAALLSHKRASGQAYLATDTHWTPAAMDRVARDLAIRVRSLGVVDDSLRHCFAEECLEVKGYGDLAKMLAPDADHPLFPRETVRSCAVESCSGGPLPEAEGARVLLLGDSFANIYSSAALGWGERAGLVDRLAFHLQEPVRALIRNDDGAHATRLELARRESQGHAPLRNIRLVIWEFSARELSVGDWRSVELNVTTERSREFVVVPSAAVVPVEGTVADMGELPDPGQAPYADFIVALHLEDVARLTPGERLKGSQALVFVWAMRDFELVEGARVRPGDRVRLALRPWTDVAAELESVTRGELYAEELLLQEPCWGELLQP